MDSERLERIARDLGELLQQQVNSVAGRGLTQFSVSELEAYQARQSRIAELRMELGKFARSTPSDAAL